MNAFDALKQFFKPTDATIALPGDPFIVIDRERAIAKLKLDERAEQNGKLNFPPADAVAPDEVEAEIIAEFGEHAARAQMDASAGHRIYGERLSELALLRELSAITSASVKAKGDYRTIVINRQGRLTLAKDAIRESYAELASFKREHGLERPAHRGLQPIYVWSTVIVSLVVESLANTAFLRVNDEYGLLGGFVAAIVVSSVNIFASFFVGRAVWPYLFHKRLGPRLMAMAVTAMWAVSLVAWNLLAGHFRDAKASGLQTPETAALGLFWEGPFQFESIYSYGLVGAGILFALLSAGAGFRKSDPYPGYGAIYERHETRCEEYADEIGESLSELKDTRDKAIGQAADIRDQLGVQFRERGQILAARDAHRLRYREHQDYLEDVANALLTRYRAANQKSRTDGARPKHFDVSWKLTRTELPADAVEPEIDEEVRSAQEALQEVIKSVADAYSESIESFEHLDKIKASLNK